MAAEIEPDPVASTLPPPPPARVRGNRWRDLEVADLGKWKPERPVSVVVPCYGSTQPLAYTLAALARQTYPRHRLEIIIADDGTDPPIEVPAIARELLEDLECTIVRQERRAFGLARARNTGAAAAGGEILVFLDADMTPEPALVEAHARWHHASSDAATLGFRTHVDFAGIAPATLYAAGQAGSLSKLFAGRERRSPEWIEAQMERTGSLTSDHDDLFRILTGGNVGVRRETFEAAGRFDETFEQYGGEDTEFAYRLFTGGALLVPERKALCWHQGLKEVIAPEETKSGQDQRAKLAQLIAQQGFRRFFPGRSYDVPYLVVRIRVDDEGAPQVTRVVESVLSNRFHDLVVCLSIPDDHPERVWLERQFSGDPRVTAGELVDDESAFPWAAVRMDVPLHAQLAQGTIEAIVERIWEGTGVVEAGVPGSPEMPPLRAVTTRALRRATRLASTEAERDVLAAELFHRAELSGGELGVLVYNSKNPLPAPVPAVAGAARLREEAEGLAARVAALTERLERTDRELRAIKSGAAFRLARRLRRRERSKA